MKPLRVIDAVVNAPLVGVTDAEPRVLHRVDIDGLPLADWETAEWATAHCGTHVKLVRAAWRAVRTRGTRFRRCRVCNGRVTCDDRARSCAGP